MTHINAFPEISSDAENDTYEVFQYMDQSCKLALHKYIMHLKDNFTNSFG